MSDPHISDHFAYAELTHTNTGLPNVPNAEQLANLKHLAETALEPARLILGPLHVNSGFRSPLVNRAVGSQAARSQHLDGLAADIVPSCDLDTAFEALRHSSILYDQLIKEDSWIHISVSNTKPRREALIAYGHAPTRYVHVNA